MNGSILVADFDHIIAKAWADESFKAALKADPRGTLEAHGLQVPEGLTLRVLENSEQVFNLVLPKVPDLGLTEEALDMNGEMDRCGGGRCGGSGGCGSGGSGGCQTCNCICW